MFLWVSKNVCIKQKCHTYTACWISGYIQMWGICVDIKLYASIGKNNCIKINICSILPAVKMEPNYIIPQQASNYSESSEFWNTLSASEGPIISLEFKTRPMLNYYQMLNSSVYLVLFLLIDSQFSSTDLAMYLITSAQGFYLL